MGLEARCVCRWADRFGDVTVLLERTELIVRGDIRARVALASLTQVRAVDRDLEFVLDGEHIALELGAVNARRWAAAIASPAPTLRRKLGITESTRLHFTGTLDDDALSAALSDVARGEITSSNLAIVRTDDRTEVLKWLAATGSHMQIPPTWIVYIKGRGAPLGENAVRQLMLRFGFIDTKVAAVSQRLTGLKFIKKR